MPRVIEEIVAESLPSEERLDRFRRLAKIQISRSVGFEKWAKDSELNEYTKKIAENAWNACFGFFKVNYMFDVLRKISVFDESFRLPSLEPTPKDKIEEKFGKLMLAVSLLTLQIQRDYEKEGATEGENHGSIRPN